MGAEALPSGLCRAEEPPVWLQYSPGSLPQSRFWLVGKVRKVKIVGNDSRTSKAMTNHILEFYGFYLQFFLLISTNKVEQKVLLVHIFLAHQSFGFMVGKYAHIPPSIIIKHLITSLFLLIWLTCKLNAPTNT